MAIGADTTLPGTLRSPLRPQGAAAGAASGPAKSTPRFGPPPPMVDDRRVADQKNNLLAGTAGAGQVALQSMDRAGVSRGKGHGLRADMAQAAADVEGASAAQQAEMGASNANRSASQIYDTTMRGEQMANAGLLENLRAASLRERYAKQGWQQDLMEAIRRGQFGLDSMQLDMSPLYDALLQ